jgi:hypothetical protein
MTPGVMYCNQPGGTDRGDGVSCDPVVLQIAVDVSYRSIVIVGIEPFQSDIFERTVIHRRSCGLHRLIIQVRWPVPRIRLWHVLCRERRCPELYHLD